MFQATTFRLALSYLAIFFVSALALVSLVSLATSMFIEWQVQETVDIEAQGLNEQYRDRGLAGLIDTISKRAAQDTERRTVYLLLSPQGERMAGNLFGWPGDGQEQGWVRFKIERMATDRLAVEILGHSYSLPDGYRLLVGRSTSEADYVKSAINRALAWGLAFTVLLGIIGGYFTSRHLLQRVDAMSRTAARINSGDMKSRMSVSGANDEFDQLAVGFNDMMDELERLVQSIRTVTDNIAHDLRTPLTRLRSRIDLALIGERSTEELRHTLEDAMAEADNLLGVFNALLAISSVEQGQRLHKLEPMDLASLVCDVGELYEPLAEDKGQSFSLERQEGVGLDQWQIKGDRHLLFQSLTNLVDNAVKYTPTGGQISLKLSQDSQYIYVETMDSGPGIAPEFRDKVFGRFVRLDHTRTNPGNGLGLSLVRAVADLHGATLDLGDNNPGLIVRLRFPRMTDTGLNNS